MKKTMLIIVAVMLLFSTVAFAVNTTIKATLAADIAVKLDGKLLSLKDAKGNVVNPIIYNGTTYLPVRAVGESLGLKVSWDGATRTVSLDSENIASNTQSATKDTYGLNEWWVVDGLWKLRIDSVEITTDRNQFHEKNPGEVVKITYTYENLGYTKRDLFLTIDNVIDSQRKAANIYPLSDSHHKAVPVGAISEKGTEFYGLVSPNNTEITIYFEQFGNGFDEHKAKFVIPITR